MRSEFFLPVTYPLSILYSSAVHLRNLLYERRALSTIKVDAQVISVGNLSAGGTGKTPLVIYLAEKLTNSGKKVCVLTRGYKRSGHEPVYSGYGERPESWEELGDEPFLIKSKCRGVAMGVNADRVAAARYMKETYGCDTFILDDGFQHRRLERDVDIVMLAAGERLEERLLLPAGRLREPLSSLGRADVFISTEGRTPIAARKHIKPGAITLEGSKEATALIDRTGRENSIDNISGKSAVAFCGIGKPESFRKSLLETGCEVADFLSFPDHVRYDNGKLERIKQAYAASGAEMLLTTEKDLLKLPLEFCEEINPAALRVEFRLVGNEAGFLEKIGVARTSSDN